MCRRFISMPVLLMFTNLAIGACIDRANPPETIGGFHKALICLEQSIVKLEQKLASGNTSAPAKQISFQNSFMKVTPRSISRGNSSSILASLIVQNKVDNNLLLAAQNGTAHLGDKRGFTVQRSTIKGLLEIGSAPAYTKQSKNYTIINPNAMQPVNLVFHSADFEGNQFDLTITLWRMFDGKAERHDVSLIGIPIEE